MDSHDLPTSPRKKLKTYHDPQPMMADAMVYEMPSKMQSSTVDGQPPMKASSGEDRLDKEVQCGITEYVSPHLPGFQGILKKRYTDFLVNEILPSGQVIHLDNVKKPADRQQQSSSSAQAPSAHKQDGRAKENTPPRFESTNLNKVEQGPRKKEIVYMQHGADTLNLVDKQDIPGLAASKATATAEHNPEVPHNEAPEAPRTGGRGVAGSVPATAEDTGDRSSLEVTAATNGQADYAGPPHPRQSGHESAVGGWQAYAESNTGTTKLTLSDEDKSLLNSYFNAETVEQILTLFRRILASPSRKARDFGTVTTDPIDRDIRTQIHQVIRRMFLSRLDSTTDDSGAMVICAANPSSSWGSRNNAGRNTGRNDRNKPQQPHGKLGWAQLGGDYLHFTIYKENRDTMETISHLARILKLRPQLFQFAGTKDRRGITIQRASVYRVQVNRLFDAGRTLRQSRIGNFDYHPQGLELGDLLGNEFVITLRDCQFQLDAGLDIEAKIEQATSIVSNAVENFSTHGFINYFGLQRFGSFSTGTHTIGRSMLQGDFKAACEGILSFHPSALAEAQKEPHEQDSNIDRDDKARASALHAFASTGHSKQALEQLPRKFSAEACLVRHLSRSDHRNDYLGALQTISRNLRLMYVHAYQSLVWNIAVSARWKAHGDKVLPGDLVLVNDHPEPSTEPDKDTAPNVDQDGESIIVPESSDRAYTSDEIFTRARAVTEAELASPDCKISIFDVVLPLPGYDIIYPNNDSANIYKEFMGSEEGGGLDPYDMRRKWKDVSLSGSYRKLLAKPLRKVEWEVRGYGAKGEDEQFVETDADKLDKAKGTFRRSDNTRDGHGAKPEDHPKAEGTSTDRQDDVAGAFDPAPTAADQGTQPKNDKIAVILKMQLGSSTYATMALRELMKAGGVKTWKVEHSGGR